MTEDKGDAGDDRLGQDFVCNYLFRLWSFRYKCYVKGASVVTVRDATSKRFNLMIEVTAALHRATWGSLRIRLNAAKRPIRVDLEKSEISRTK